MIFIFDRYRACICVYQERPLRYAPILVSQTDTSKYHQILHNTFGGKHTPFLGEISTIPLVLSTACYHVCARGRQSVSSVLRALGIAKRTRRGVHSTPGTRSTKRVARRTVPVLAVPSFDRKNRKNPAQRFGCFHTPPFLYRSSPHTAPLRWGTKGAKSW